MSSFFFNVVGWIWSAELESSTFALVVLWFCLFIFKAVSQALLAGISPVVSFAVRALLILQASSNHCRLLLISSRLPKIHLASIKSLILNLLNIFLFPDAPGLLLSEHSPGRAGRWEGISTSLERGENQRNSIGRAWIWAFQVTLHLHACCCPVTHYAGWFFWFFCCLSYSDTQEDR